MEAEIFYVLVGAVAVAAFARWRNLPAPLLVTVVALVLSFVPFVPTLTIDGHVLLNLVLPPLLYSAALDVSFVGFTRSLPQIRRLGITLVLVTTVAVGFVAWWIFPALTLPGALLLGAIVAPPDAVSAAAIGRRLGLPRRVMTVLSGESLINDATSLTLYRVLTVLIAGAAVTIQDGLWQFALAVGAGLAVGLVFGFVIHQLRMRVNDPVVIGTVGLLVPFGAYGIAEHLGGSGVLAVVATGLYVGFNAPLTDYRTRQQETPLWLSADFLLESFVFAYIGLQFPRVLNDLAAESVTEVVVLSLAVLGVTIVVRPLFVYPAHAIAEMRERAWLRRWNRQVESGRYEQRLARVNQSSRRRPPTIDEVNARIASRPILNWKDNAVISWAGMRGVVTLATALAAADLAGLDDQASHVIVIVAFVVTVGTLLLQGVTLPVLIRVLRIETASEVMADEDAVAGVRKRTKEAGMAFLQLKRAEWVAAYGEQSAETFDLFAHKMAKIEKATAEAQESEDAVARPTYAAFVELSRGWLAVRREVLLAERDNGNLDEEVMRELLTAMDAEELAMDTRGATRPQSRVAPERQRGRADAVVAENGTAGA